MDDTTKQADSAAPVAEAKVESKETYFGTIHDEAKPDNAVAEQSGEQSQEKEAPKETATPKEESQPKDTVPGAQIPEKFKGDIGKFVKAYSELEKARTEDRTALAELKAKVEQLTPAQQDKVQANAQADVKAAQEAGYFDDLDNEEKNNAILDMMAKSARRTLFETNIKALQTSEAKAIIVPMVREAFKAEHEQRIAQQQAEQTAQREAIAKEVAYVKGEYKDEDWESKEIWDGIVKELEADKTIKLETAYHRARNKRTAKEAPGVLGAGKGTAPDLEAKKLSGAERVQSQLEEVLSKPRGFGPGI